MYLTCSPFDPSQLFTHIHNVTCVEFVNGRAPSGSIQLLVASLLWVLPFSDDDSLLYVIMWKRINDFRQRLLNTHRHLHTHTHNWTTTNKLLSAHNRRRVPAKKCFHVGAEYDGIPGPKSIRKTGGKTYANSAKTVFGSCFLASVVLSVYYPADGEKCVRRNEMEWWQWERKGYCRRKVSLRIVWLFCY